MIETGYVQVLTAFFLVALAFVLSRIKSIPVEKEMAFGSVRTFIQLIAVGYALEFIFNSESFYLVLLSYRMIAIYMVKSLRGEIGLSVMVHQY